MQQGRLPATKLGAMKYFCYPVLGALLLGACSTFAPGPFTSKSAKDLSPGAAARVSGNSSNPLQKISIILREVDGEAIPTASDGSIASPVLIAPGMHKFRFLSGTTGRGSPMFMYGRIANPELSAAVEAGRSYIFVGHINEVDGPLGSVSISIKDVGDHSIPSKCLTLNNNDPDRHCGKFSWHPGVYSTR